MDTFSTVGIVLATLILGGLGTFCLVKMAGTDGRIDYCYVTTTQTPGASYKVVGHRPWRPDVDVAFFGDAKTADDMVRSSVVCGAK